MYCVLLYMIYFGDELGIGLDVSELSWGWVRWVEYAGVLGECGARI